MRKYCNWTLGYTFCSNYFWFNSSFQKVSLVKMLTVLANDDLSKNLISSSLHSWGIKVFNTDQTFFLSGMLPSHMQHPFVDRYRDSHNASPRSLTDEDTMNPPTSGKCTQNEDLFTHNDHYVWILLFVFNCRLLMGCQIFTFVLSQGYRCGRIIITPLSNLLIHY